ncbi:MAG: hypothetical protein ABFS42_10185 [Candidatus Krumholzibacteriota bacterium]
MTRCPNILFWVAALIIMMSLVLVAGCSDDDPVSPGPLPDDGYLAVSPDSLMALWKTALTTMDSTMYGDLIDPDFRFRFSTGDLNEYQLLTEYMTGDEIVQTAWRMFSGEGLTNWLGKIVPGVTRISFPFMTQDTPWEILAAGENSRASARFTLQMFVERGSGVSTLAATGTFDFVAMSSDTVAADGSAVQYYRLLDMVEVDPVKDSGVVHTWGGVHLTYLTNEAPQAALEVTDIGGAPLLYRGDATGSHDPDSGFLPEPYRWQFETEGGWSEWSADPVAYHDYLTWGIKTVTVQVRDRWGAVAEASQEINVLGPDLVFPDTPEKLMENFQEVYEWRYFEGYRELMHPDFLTFLQDATIMEFPDVGTTLDYNEERRIHERMFSGEAVTDPNGDLVPGVVNISFTRFQQLETFTSSPPDDIIPDTEWAPYEVDFLFDRGQSFSYLRVQGTIRFYVSGRDSLHNGAIKQYYEMVGQVDLTNLPKGVEGINWGSVKALFR